MKSAGAMEHTEAELNALVSIAIRRAELLEDIQSSAVNSAWLEVMAYEQRLASITRADEIPGGVARVGAISAALAAGEHLNASRLEAQYLAEADLPDERRSAIEQAFKRDEARLAARFPALARRGTFTELRGWRANAYATPHVFPCMA